jgi:hypothetical protein
MERKEIIKALGEHFGVEPKYMGAPSFAYEIASAEETYTVDREGKVITSAGNDVEFESIINGKVGEEKPTETEISSFKVAIPMDGHTGITLRNLVNMVYSKQTLIKKSLGISVSIIEDDFCKGINKAKIETLEDFKLTIENIGAESCPGIGFDFFDKTIRFKFLDDNASSEKIKAYTQFAELLSHSAKSLKRVSAKAKDTDNDKFTFRVFLIRLGMVGDEYKTARKILLENLEGNSAFKDGKKPEKVTAE